MMNNENIIYLYGMITNGYSIACQPNEGLLGLYDHINNDNKTYKRDYWDVIAYNRKLTDEEIYKYDLDYIREELI